MTAYEVRSYTGNAADTVLNANINATALSFSVAPGTGNGYPDGSQGPFYVFLDYDTSGIEKVRCTGRINDTFTIPDTASRGVDGTTAQSHTANAKVRHGWTATDAQEANRAAANTVGKVTTKGDLLAATAANTLARVAAGSDGALLVADSTQTTGLRYATSLPTAVGIPNVTTSQTAFVTTVGGLSSFSIGNGTITPSYHRLFSLVWFQINVAWGSTSSTTGGGQWTFTLPSGLTPVTPASPATIVGVNGSGVMFGVYGAWTNPGGTLFTGFSTGAHTMAAGDILYISGVYAVA